MNRGVGGVDDRGDLIEVVESGDGLETGVLRKTRAGGNWLTGGMMVLLCGNVVWLLGCMDVKILV